MGSTDNWGRGCRSVGRGCRSIGRGCRNVGRGKPLSASWAALSSMESSMVIIGSYSSCNGTMMRNMIESMWCCKDRDGK